jgi:transcriptional regulator with XRE-family HTH domain
MGATGRPAEESASTRKRMNGRERKTPSRILERLRADYAADPEPVRAQSRAYRQQHRDAVNARRRQRAAQQRDREQAATWEAYQQNPAYKNLPSGEQLRLWLDAKGWTVRQCARHIGVSARSVHDWLNGTHPPDRPKRRRLYEATGLECFYSRVPEKKPRYAEGSKLAAAVLRDLTIRCGLASREIRGIETSQVEARGIRMSAARFIRFGDAAHEVSGSAVKQWISSAQPTKYLFFQHKPVDRSRPGTPKWIIRMLKLAGVVVRRSQTPRIQHFANDAKRFGTGPRLLKHLREFHRLSKTHSTAVWKELIAGTRRPFWGGTRSILAQPATPKRGEKGGQRLSARVIEKGRFCDRVVQEMRQIKSLCVDSGWTIAEIQTNHPEFAAWKVRDTLAEEDRNVFNHPRQWGPTVGYGRLVLGKHYGRHADTVKDWIKAFRSEERVRLASAASSPTP